jgi:hypothetical protein
MNLRVFGWIVCVGAVVTGAMGCAAAEAVDDAKLVQPTSGERHWIGPAYWGNRLQDWRFRDGRIECVTPQGWLSMRTVHDLTKQVVAEDLDFELSVDVAVPQGDSFSSTSAAGMLIGVGRGQMDYRSASIVHDKSGYGGGIFAGIDGNGEVFIVDNEKSWKLGDSMLRSALPRNGWKVSVDSAEPDGPAENAIDGNPRTHWHTEFRQRKPGHPHEMVIDLGRAQSFEAMAVLPRQANDSGRVGDFEVYATNRLGEWGESIASGRLPNTSAMQVIALPDTTARYVKLVAKSAQRPQPATTVAELYLLKERADEGADQDTPRVLPKVVRLTITGAFEPGDDTGEMLRLPKQRITVRAIDPADGSEIGSATRRFETERVLGNVAIVSHPGNRGEGLEPALYAFENWSVAGDAIAHRPAQANSAVLGTQYTLTNNVLKMTAQLMPLGDDDPLKARLDVKRNGAWIEAASADVVVPGYTATFRIESWDDTTDTTYRVVYDLPDGDQTLTYTWQGTVRQDPVEKDKIVVAGFTGNHMNSKPMIRQSWNGDPASEGGNYILGMYYPHADLTSKVEQHRPDLLFFSGDQVYEGASPTFADRQNIELDYLYKWYLFVVSYRDLMKDIPTVTIPDDHDVYQGNIWGQGGRKAPGADHTGGYVYPASFVQMVHRTQVAHLPDPADPTPIDQGISYYTSDVKWGRVSFAVIADRMFKNGCAGQGLPPSGTGRPDHYNNPSFDTADLDIDGMKLLGDRQLGFLDDWAANWHGAEMKMVLSQTVFANMATHHGAGLGHLIADLDSNGWPQTGRNKAIGAMRKAFAFHLAGDQHLATLVHHGIDEHKDAIWSFCVPSVANFYPRAWAPEIKNPYQKPENEAFMGDRLDGFKNKVTVYAASNPGDDMGHLPKELHNRMPGYGIVIVDKSARTYEAQCWPRFADPSKPDQMYAGWPRTIAQIENYGKTPTGFLPTVTWAGEEDFVVAIRKQATGELVYAKRIKGDAFTPMVFEDAVYTVTLEQPESGRREVRRDQRAEMIKP